jgi:6-pyruvoyltetrahydropterin/6-carboxytetrahydropterin synthase
MAHWQSTKTFGHELGISCAFRQWRAKHSHCQYLHGYALSFKFTFECSTLDDKNWCEDFGNLKGLKEKLFMYFDHKVVLAHDDPKVNDFLSMTPDAMQVTVLSGGVGCEKFAEFAYGLAVKEVALQHSDGRVKVVSCEVSEHGANSAIYFGD